MDDENRIRILVLDRGFVLVCRCPDPRGVGLWLPYTDRRTIRRWGTTNGLGELATGPTQQTTMDALVAAGTVPVRAVLDVLEVEQEPWERHLRPNPDSSKAATSPTGRSSSRTGSRSGAPTG
jgi:hypothetical protein